jgi:chromosome segregation ATPase
MIRCLGNVMANGRTEEMEGRGCEESGDLGGEMVQRGRRASAPIVTVGQSTGSVVEIDPAGLEPSGSTAGDRGIQRTVNPRRDAGRILSPKSNDARASRVSATQIAERDQQIAVLTDQVRLRDRAIRDLQDLLATARREAKAALTTATDTQRAVEIYRAQVEDREYRLDMLQQAFDEQAEQLGVPQETFDEQAERLAALQQAFDEQRGRLGVSQETFDEQAERLSALQTTLDQQTEHLDAMHAQVEFMSSREDELRQMLLDAHEQLLARDEELQHSHIRDAQLIAAVAELESARAFIEHVRSSKVWMLARLYWAPLGWLKKLLGR